MTAEEAVEFGLVDRIVIKRDESEGATPGGGPAA